MQRAPSSTPSSSTSCRGTGTLSLPEGMAMRLPAGQRWSADVHYINTTEQTVLVNNAFNLGLIPANEVTRWISSRA